MVKFSVVFKGNYLNYVTKYKENIQKVLNEYDIVIFMARKAICFYESMVINGEIEKTRCEVFSSRIIDYNIIKKIKGKKIAIVDDVVVKGTSLSRVINLLSKENIKAYVLVVACESSFPNSIIGNGDFEMCDSYVTFSKDDIYSFAGMITEYIEASMCPFNIDQPIYALMDVPKSKLNKLLTDYKSIDISSGLQQTYGIENKVIYFQITNSVGSSKIFKLIPQDAIIKVRLMADKTRILAIPFVLFSELTISQLEELYSFISNDFLDGFVCVDNKLVTYENKMKVVSYFLSEILVKNIFSLENIRYEKIVDNDIFQFSISTDELFTSNNVVLDDWKFYLSNISVQSYSKFKFSSIIGSCYKAIIKAHINKKFIDSNNVLIDELIITHKYFKEKINDYNNSELLASSVIDVFIDRGMMVPTIVHFDSNIIRAYKMGEYSKLTRSQIESFAAMLYQYQEMINSELGKTELEKLCVLYFNMAINRGIFPQQACYEEDCYSICYSLFGPRVSTSNTVYNANTDSVLITDFCQKKDGESIVTYKNGKYTVNPYHVSGRMAQFVIGFAHPYSAVSKMFNSKAEQSSSLKWNMYVHTYVQYLTLRAIGNNKKSQYLSLCAELYQLSNLKDNFFELKNKENKESEWILKGINSGLWKYWCYKNDALNKTSMQIYEKNNDVGAWLLSDVEPASDESAEWDNLIEDAARLLYKSAFLINEVLKTQNKLDLFNTGDDICEINSSNVSKNTIFTAGSYYAEFKEMRHEYEGIVKINANFNPDFFRQWVSLELKKLKISAIHQLDLCDQVMEQATTKYTSIKKLLVVYSPSENFPVNISDGLNEVYFEGIAESKFCRIFGLSIKESNISDLTDLLDRIESSSKEYDLKYFVFDVGEDNEINFIDNKVKDRQLAKILNYTIDAFNKRKLNRKTELVLVSHKSYDGSFKHGNHEFTLGDVIADEAIKSSLSDKLYNHSGQQLTVKIYNIQGSTVNIEGENAMKIDNKGQIDNIFKQHGDNSTNTIVQGDNNPIPKEMIRFLDELIKLVNETDKAHVKNAAKSAKKGDTSRFVEIMRLIGNHTKSIIENIAQGMLYDWLKKNGII